MQADLYAAWVPGITRSIFAATKSDVYVLKSEATCPDQAISHYVLLQSILLVRVPPLCVTFRHITFPFTNLEQQ